MQIWYPWSVLRFSRSFCLVCALLMSYCLTVYVMLHSMAMHVYQPKGFRRESLLRHLLQQESSGPVLVPIFARATYSRANHSWANHSWANHSWANHSWANHSKANHSQPGPLQLASTLSPRFNAESSRTSNSSVALSSPVDSIQTSTSMSKSPPSLTTTSLSGQKTDWLPDQKFQSLIKKELMLGLFLKPNSKVYGPSRSTNPPLSFLAHNRDMKKLPEIYREFLKGTSAKPSFRFRLIGPDRKPGEVFWPQFQRQRTKQRIGTHKNLSATFDKLLNRLHANDVTIKEPNGKQVLDQEINFKQSDRSLAQEQRNKPPKRFITQESVRQEQKPLYFLTKGHALNGPKRFLTKEVIYKVPKDGLAKGHFLKAPERVLPKGQALKRPESLMTKGQVIKEPLITDQFLKTPHRFLTKVRASEDFLTKKRFIKPTEQYLTNGKLPTYFARVQQGVQPSNNIQPFNNIPIKTIDTKTRARFYPEVDGIEILKDFLTEEVGINSPGYVSSDEEGTEPPESVLEEEEEGIETLERLLTADETTQPPEKGRIRAPEDVLAEEMGIETLEHFLSEDNTQPPERLLTEGGNQLIDHSATKERGGQSQKPFSVLNQSRARDSDLPANGSFQQSLSSEEKAHDKNNQSLIFSPAPSAEDKNGTFNFSNATSSTSSTSSPAPDCGDLEFWTKDETVDLYRPVLTGQDLCTLMDTSDVLVSTLTVANITFFMYSGSLLGSWRHHGPVPWDDDVDFVVDVDQYLTLYYALLALQPRYILDIHNYVRYKLYSAQHTRPTRFSWKFPFVDISFYRQNATHIWDVDYRFTRFLYPKDWVFPLVKRPFKGRLWPAPRNSERVLRRTYSLDTCQTRIYSHSLEAVLGKYQTVACVKLHPFLPFVRRQPLKGGACLETLVQGGRVLGYHYAVDRYTCERTHARLKKRKMRRRQRKKRTKTKMKDGTV